MNILAIDTSTKNLSLAVAKSEKVLKYRNVKLQRPLSSSIMPSIKRILDEMGMTLKQLDGFAVGLGPGSFTGLRVGLSTIKGLAFATGKPAIGIASLDVLAMTIQEDNVQICTLCDAKRNLVYACLYEKKGSVLKQKSAYVLKSIQEVLKLIQGRVIFIGDGVQLFQNEIRKAKGLIPTLTDRKWIFPQARWLIPLAYQRIEKNKWDDVDHLIPLYLYPEHCQVKNNL